MSWLDLAIPLLFLALLAGVGLLTRAKRKNTEDYLLMARRLSLPGFVMGLVASWYGGILGVSEYSYTYGLSNWFVFGVPYYLHAALFAIFFAQRARRTRYVSMADQLEAAYGVRAAQIGALVIFLTTMPAAYVLMIGKLAEWMFGFPYWLALLIGLLVSTMYIYSGGLKGLVRADMIYFAVMYGGFMIMVVALVSQFGGMGFLKANVPRELFTPTGGQAFGAVFVWYIIASTALVEPLFFELTYAAKSARIVPWGILISIAFWALFDFMTTTTGLYARALLKNLADPAFAFPELARQVLPAGLFGLFLAALLATVMSTIDSYTFIAAQALGRDFFWRGLKNREATDTTRFVRISLIATFVGAYLLALFSNSIIALWHGLGSVAAPALLLPMLTSWSRRWRFPRVLILPGMVVPAAISLVWRVWPDVSGSEGYWLGVEPVYIGLCVSTLFYLIGQTKKDDAVLNISTIS